MSYEMPEGAQEAVKELMKRITTPIEDWVTNATDKSDEFKRGAVLCALVSTLVSEALFYEIPAEAVVHSVLITLKGNGAFDDDDDDQTVH